MRVRRAQARLCGRDARAPRVAKYLLNGEGDPPAVIRAWFRVAGLTVALWIPAFAGMTGG